MPNIIKFFRDPIWTFRGPLGGPGGHPGVPKFYQELTTSQDTSRVVLELEIWGFLGSLSFYMVPPSKKCSVQ